MRALKGRTVRILPNHRSADGVRYREYCDAKLARLGPLSRDGMYKLAELASIEVFELPRLMAQEHRLQALKKRTPKLESDLRRIARTRHRLRMAARNLEQDLTQMRPTPAPVTRPPTMQELLSDMNGGGQR